MIDDRYYQPKTNKIIYTVEELMKKYNIPKENIAADRNTLNFIFVKQFPAFFAPRRDLDIKDDD